MVAGKTGESGDICGRNLKKSTTMEIMTIESNGKTEYEEVMALYTGKVLYFIMKKI